MPLQTWQKIQPNFRDSLLILYIGRDIAYECVRIDRYDKDRTFNQFRLTVFLYERGYGFTKLVDSICMNPKCEHKKCVKRISVPMNQGEILAEYVSNKKKMAGKNKILRKRVRSGCTIKQLLQNYGNIKLRTPYNTSLPKMSKLNVKVIEARLIENWSGIMTMVIETMGHFYTIDFCGP